MRFPKVTRVFRDFWERGNDSSLYDSETHKFCILGFVCLQMGIDKGVLSNETRPEHLDIDIPILTKFDSGDISDTDFSDSAIVINDDCKISEIGRERKLKTLFKRYGKKLEFI